VEEQRRKAASKRMCSVWDTVACATTRGADGTKIIPLGKTNWKDFIW